MSNPLEMMFTDLIDKIWGNLKTSEARVSWCKLQEPLAKADFEKYRKEYIEMKLPETICKHLFVNSESWQDFKRQIRDQGEWVKFFKLEEQFNEAYNNIRKQNGKA